MSGLWDAGWLDRARRVDSPNCDARPVGAVVDTVVVHSISLPPGEYGSTHIEQLFTNQLVWSEHPYFETIRGARVSAHFLVRRTGELIQFVSIGDRAWHAGRSAWSGRAECNDYGIGVELEGLEGFAFEHKQMRTLARLLLSIDRCQAVASVVGHEHVAPDRKRDPGASFDWHLLRKLTGWGVDQVPCTDRQPTL